MKKNLLAVCGLLFMTAATAQNAYVAERMLGSDLNGTARFIGMGGAMGALGGDMSVMGTNPAGLGIYRSNDVSVSFGFNNTGTESSFNGTSMKEDRTRTSFDQIGFVYSNKIGNNTSLRFVNFGFNYHKNKNFNRLFSMGGALDGFSQTNYLADEMDWWGMQSGTDFDAILDAENPYSKYFGHYPVLGLMGVSTALVDWDENLGAIGWNGTWADFFSKETGGISQYDFSVAFNIEDRFYIGATLGVYDVNYNRYTSYAEELDDDEGNPNGGYSLNTYYGLDGSGIDLKLGVIYRPFEDSPFRIGLAVHTPTWYDLTETYNASMDASTEYYGKYNVTLSDELHPDYLIYDFRMSTPWKFNVSMGTTFSNLVAVGAEYEYQDYSSSKLEDMDGYELVDGQASVDEFLKGVHTFRVGMEACLAPQFSVRAGYNYSSAAFEDDAYNALSLYGVNTDFNNTKSKNTITFGLGYRGSVVYADLAYKYDMYKSEFCAFDSNYNFSTEDYDYLPYTKVENSRHQLVFTLGARF